MTAVSLKTIKMKLVAAAGVCWSVFLMVMMAITM